MAEIEKPLSMQRREFITELNNLINSGLDLYIVEPIMHDALIAVQSALQHREVKEQAEYNKQINEKEGNLWQQMTDE